MIGRKLNPDLRAGECAMRCLLITQEAFAGGAQPMMGDIVDTCRERLGISRPSAFRLVRTAIDVLCIPYDRTAHGRRRAEKMQLTLARVDVRERMSNAQKRRWDNPEHRSHSLVLLRTARKRREWGLGA